MADAEDRAYWRMMKRSSRARRMGAGIVESSEFRVVPEKLCEVWAAISMSKRTDTYRTIAARLGYPYGTFRGYVDALRAVGVIQREEKTFMRIIDPPMFDERIRDRMKGHPNDSTSTSTSTRIEAA